jgi:hypothetical protein
MAEKTLDQRVTELEEVVASMGAVSGRAAEWISSRAASAKATDTQSPAPAPEAAAPAGPQ